ncbi:hypothetical protein A1O3_10423, partial [Capronia epimyces CBS 606.96]
TIQSDSSSSTSVAARDLLGSVGTETPATSTNADGEYDGGGSATCNECQKDPGICCAVQCQSGLCPKIAIENGGWTVNGVKITGGGRRR